jgi:hypothetical protein
MIIIFMVHLIFNDLMMMMMVAVVSGEGIINTRAMYHIYGAS